MVITYIFFSWWAWWFGASFGARCYVGYYAMIALPMAVTVEKITSLKNYFLTTLIFLIMVLFCYYSVAMSTIHITHGVWDGPDWRWNYERWWDDLVRKII